MTIAARPQGKSKASTTVRAGIYVRLSEDREGTGEGVKRQREDCEALCERLGWHLVDVYEDNDTSAFSGKARKAWKRLLADIDAGTVNAIAAWHIDRLTRRPRELEDVIDLADSKNLQLATFTGAIDLATPSGRMIARTLGTGARYESEQKAARQVRAIAQAAAAGKVHGGRRPFGYAPGLATLVPEEAEIVREAARRVLANESLAAICRDFAARGVETATGVTFKATTLRRLLVSARISGRRETTPVAEWRSGGGTSRPLLGEIVATKAVWPAIITAADSDRLRALLSNPDRLSRAPGTGRSYLLSGILRCGKCGAGMVGRPRSGTPRYVCPNTPGTDSCGSLATVAEPTDDLVRALVIDALASRKVEAMWSASGSDEDAALSASVERGEEQLRELATDWAGERITRSEWHAARAVIEARIGRDRAKLARVSHTAALTSFRGSPEDLCERWAGMNVSQRRAVVGAVIERIVVAPANPRKKWDPDRFTPTYRF